MYILYIPSALHPCILYIIYLVYYTLHRESEYARLLVVYVVNRRESSR